MMIIDNTNLIDTLIDQIKDFMNDRQIRKLGNSLPRWMIEKSIVIILQIYFIKIILYDIMIKE